jgi:hypothetical protein
VLSVGQLLFQTGQEFGESCSGVFGKSGFGAKPKRNFVLKFLERLLSSETIWGGSGEIGLNTGRGGVHRDSSAFNASLPEAFQIYYFQINIIVAERPARCT